MPVPGEEEPRVLSPHPQQHDRSNKFYGAIPIKKRRLPLIHSLSPLPEEKPFPSEDYESKEEKDSSIPDQGLPISTSKDMVPPWEANVNKNLELPVKKERVADKYVDSAEVNMHLSGFKAHEANHSSIGFCHDLKSIPNLLENEKSTKQRVSGIRDVTQVLNVKQEMASGEIEGTCQLDLSTGFKNVGLLLGAKKPFIHALEHKISEGVTEMSGQSDLSSLSLDLSQEKIVSLDNNNSSSSGDVSSGVSVNRSNWDLNMSMDDWAGSFREEGLVYKGADIGRFNKTSVGHDLRSSPSGSGVVGISLNKGKQVLNECKSNSPNTSLQSSQQHKLNDNLSLSLAIPCRQFDASNEHSSLSNNTGSESANPTLNWGQLQLQNVNLKFTRVSSVKLEPVDENSKLDCTSCSSSNSTVPKLHSMKTECVENHSLEYISPQKLVDHTSMKSELVQEGNVETLMSADTALPQSFGKTMHHQESSTSSAFSIPLTPHNSCPSRFSTCLELPMSRDLLNQFEHPFTCKESLGHRNTADERNDALAPNPASQSGNQLRLCKTEDLNVQGAENCKLSVDEHSHESSGNSEPDANEEGKINISAEMLEEDSFGSDCKSDGNHASSIHTDVEEMLYDKEDGEYEDGEVREQPKHEGVAAITEETKTENVVHLQSTVFLVNRDTGSSNFGEKPMVTENFDETGGEKINERVVGLNELKTIDESLQSPVSDKAKEVEEKSVCAVSPEKSLDLSGRKNVNSGHEKEVSASTKESHGIGGITVDGDAVDKIVDVCPGKHESTLSKVEASLHGNDTVKDSNSAANKSRIITLPLTSVVSTSGKPRSLSSRLLTPQTGKERYSDSDREMHSRGNRDELYIDDHDKFRKDRFHSRSFRDSRQSFMLGKGRVLGRFGSLHSERDSDRDYVSETFGRNDYRVSRHKHASSIANELECNEYDITPDGSSLGGRIKKTMNDELSSLRYPHLRRLSPGDIEGHVTRGIQIPHRFHRNFSSSRCTVEDDTDFVGLQHGDKFMRHASDDMTYPVFTRPRTLYDELDDQLVRGYKNFSNVHRKNYSRIHLKSPIRSRTRSPVPWSSPQQRSPNGLPELNRHRSPVLYRMGRTRSPDQACFRDEMVSRRCISSYVTQHTNDLRDLDSEREHVHPMSASSNRRSSGGRLFPRGTGRVDVLSSRERADGDDYSNGPDRSSKFQELHCDESFDERGNFANQRGLIRSFRPNHNRDNQSYQFHLNDGSKPYRFSHNDDTGFVERNSSRERAFDGHMKHPSLSVSRRVRDIEEQQNRNPRPDGQMWHGDGYSDVSRMKRRKF